MRCRRLALPAHLALVAALTFTSSARADGLPGNPCGVVDPLHPPPNLLQDVGNRCDAGDTPGDGVCIATTCAVGHGEDGGAGAEVPCSQCVMVNGGDEDATTTQPGTAGTTGDASATSHANGDSSSGGCSTSRVPQDGALGAVMLGVGLVALGWGRRKPRAPSR